MKSYFYVFVGVSLFTFLLVMQQIRSAVADTKRESEAWLSIDVSAMHQRAVIMKNK